MVKRVLAKLKPGLLLFCHVHHGGELHLFSRPAYQAAELPLAP